MSYKLVNEKADLSAYIYAQFIRKTYKFDLEMERLLGEWYESRYEAKMPI